MTNAEKYLKDGVSTNEFANSITDYILCKTHLDEDNFGEQICSAITEILRAKIKPTLTEDERVILRNINKRYKEIRKIDGELQICTGSPSYNYHLFIEFDHLFRFIKERRRI